MIDKHTKGRRGTFARVRRIIEEGLVIAGMHFVFCCFGESQVKSVPRACPFERFRRLTKGCQGEGLLDDCGIPPSFYS